MTGPSRGARRFDSPFRCFDFHFAPFRDPHGPPSASADLAPFVRFRPSRALPVPVSAGYSADIRCRHSQRDFCFLCAGFLCLRYELLFSRLSQLLNSGGISLDKFGFAV
jgi:hypothetical protein